MITIGLSGVQVTHLVHLLTVNPAPPSGVRPLLTHQGE